MSKVLCYTIFLIHLTALSLSFTSYFNHPHSFFSYRSRLQYSSLIQYIIKRSDGSPARLFSTISDDNTILKQIDSWACVKSCGACCKLGPIASRPDLKEYLTDEEYSTYSSMIGDDDWCINFDKVNRMCKIYETRPRFCRVEPENFERMFEVPREDFSDFCNFCCTENISDVYGEDSAEMKRFKEIYESLNPDEYEDAEEYIIDPKSGQSAELEALENE